MGTGISTRFVGSGRGGFKQDKNNDHIRGLLATALGPGESGNPFQDLGLGEDMIFDPADSTTFNDVRDRIKEIFEDFERAELATLQQRQDNLKVTFDSTAPEGGSYGMIVYAVNMETDSPFDMTVLGGPGGLRVV